jgi:non-ribosomal peptide synthetase component F
MVESPDVALSEVSMMDVEEEKLVLEVWNDTQQPYPESATAHELFEMQAARTPHGIALMFEGQELSYAELLACTSRLGGELQHRGACVDQVVGLCAEKSIEEVVGMVGIMRSGAAYVPLDSKLPVVRLRFLVEECSCRMVVAQLKFGAIVEAIGECWMCLWTSVCLIYFRIDRETQRSDGSAFIFSVVFEPQVTQWSIQGSV